MSRKATAKTEKLNQSASSSLSSTQKSQNDTDTSDSTDLQILQQPMNITSDFTGDADTVDTYPKSLWRPSIAFLFQVRAISHFLKLLNQCVFFVLLCSYNVVFS